MRRNGSARRPRTAQLDGTPIGRPRARRLLRGRRRRDRGGGPQLPAAATTTTGSRRPRLAGAARRAGPDLLVAQAASADTPTSTGPGTPSDSGSPWPTASGCRSPSTCPRPGRRPQPCLLEALPYRKDDLTSLLRVRSTTASRRATATRSPGSTCAAPAAAAAARPTSTRAQEQADLLEVIAWLAAQPWCTGNGGHVRHVVQRVQLPADGVRAAAGAQGGSARSTPPTTATPTTCTTWAASLKWLDLVDYCHYMTPMNALPPCPPSGATGWREEWLGPLRRARAVAADLDGAPAPRRLLAARLDPPGLRPDRSAPTMIVAGWADGYRNNTFRTIEALARSRRAPSAAGRSWAHASTVELPARAADRPGPRDGPLVGPLAARRRQRRRRRAGGASGSSASPTRPAADLDTVPGDWRADDWPSPRLGRRVRSSSLGRRPYAVRPDVGTAAWISCAGHLPYGQSLDQRHDDAESLTWDFDADEARDRRARGAAPARCRRRPASAARWP